VRLKVIPKFGVRALDPAGGERVTTRTHVDEFPPGAKEFVCVEIVNLSSFPVTISRIGFRKRGRRDGAYIMYRPGLSGVKTWPPRLESRESVTAYGPEKATLAPARVANARAFVETDCGCIQYGTSPAFKDYVRGLADKIAKHD
jgi:hypothetical protein